MKEIYIRKIVWINRPAEHSGGNFAIIEWKSDDIKEENLKELF